MKNRNRVFAAGALLVFLLSTLFPFFSIRFVTAQFLYSSVLHRTCLMSRYLPSSLNTFRFITAFLLFTEHLQNEPEAV